MRKTPDFFIVLGLLLIGAGVFTAGIGWGLPSHRIDPYLFGQHQVWSGRDIIALTGSPLTDNSHAVDVSTNPIDPTRPTIVNADDEQRARIVRRYRLMSYQPDEFATFASLAAMKPAQYNFDPRMYKYGGLWVYPVGAMLKFAGLAGLLQLKPDMAWYLDKPEEFGRFYVVARLYSALWGLLGIAAVFMLVQRLGGSTITAAFSGLCFMLMPVVINAAHEAKPHLAGAVLMLLTVMAAGRYSESGEPRSWYLAVVLAGLALGMVLSSLPILLVLVVMECLRGWPRSRTASFVFGWRIFSGLLVAAAVFLLTNPYIAINSILNRAVLHSHFDNASRFYHADWRGIPNALLLIGIGASFVLALVGGVGFLIFIRQFWAVGRRKRIERLRHQPTHILLVLLGLSLALQFTLFANGQPTDYARFALMLDIFLVIEAAILVQTAIRSRTAQTASFGLLILATGWMGSAYLRAFVLDSSVSTSRMAEAARLEQLLSSGIHRIAISNEPAPWNLPPMDLWHATLIQYPNLEPGNLPSDVDSAITLADRRDHTQFWKWFGSASVSWASKHFDIQRASHIASMNNFW